MNDEIIFEISNDEEILFEFPENEDQTGNGTLPTPSDEQIPVGTVLGTWVLKTIAQVKTLLGLGSAAYAETTDFSKVTQITSLTLLAASWTTGVTYKEYVLTNANITAASIVDVIPDNAYNAIVSAAQILPATVSAAGQVTIYAINIPTGNIGVTINILN